MLRTWIKDQEKILNSAKGIQKDCPNTPAEYPEMETKLHELFLQKRAIGQKVGYSEMQG
jgi:hypothetical protein